MTNGPRYGRAYPTWDRAPGDDTPAALRILWLETALGVLLLNSDDDAKDAAAHQADMVLRRLADREAQGVPVPVPSDRREY